MLPVLENSFKRAFIRHSNASFELLIRNTQSDTTQESTFIPLPLEMLTIDE